MTANQLKARELEETKRSNLERERETKRSNKEKERQGRVTNRTEGIKTVGNLALGAAKIAASANDPAWYKLDPSLVNDVAQISMATPLGYPVKDFGTIKDSRGSVQPGIMGIHFIPSIGGSSTIGDIAAIASKNIYAYVRYANSGARNYEAQDLMMYLYAIGQAYAYHAFMTRLYSLAKTSKSENRYYIDAMIKACGVDPEDLRNNLANFRAYINSYAVRVNSFYAPKSMPIYLRWYWMNSTMFKDQPVKKSQEYIFIQDGFGIYNDVEGKLEIDPKQFHRPANDRTVAYITNLGNRIINGLINSEDAGIMAGDILKAYGESNMLFINSIGEDYHIESVYSEEVLSQITNATLMGDPVSSVDISQIATTGKIFQGEYITQSTSAQSQPTATSLNSNNYGMLFQLGVYKNTGAEQGRTVEGLDFDAQILNMYKDNVTPDDVMVATRLISVPKQPTRTTLEPNPLFRGDALQASGSSTKWGLPLEQFGTEVCTNAIISRLDETDATSVISEWVNQSFCTSYNGLQDYMVEFSLAMAKFDWAPIIYVPRLVGDTLNVGGTTVNINKVDKYYGNTRDSANYAQLDRRVLSNLHYTAVLSELGVPLLGTKVRSR